jgi:hypothetical protein
MDKSQHRIEKNYGQSLRNWEKIDSPITKKMHLNSFSEMGWGRLVFAHTGEVEPRHIHSPQH